MQGDVSQNGTQGRVYGGDCELVHVKDGTRKAMGQRVAEFVDCTMRELASAEGKSVEGKALCPGCTMIALFNAAIELANASGQSLSELGNTMSQAFAKLAANPASGMTEEIAVILDRD